MKKNSTSQTGIFNPRVLTACALVSVSALLTFLSFATPSPSADTLSTSHRSITYTDSTGSATNPSAVVLGKPDCTVPMSCSTFTLTIDPSVGVLAPGYDPTQYEILITESWQFPLNDYDTFVENSAGNVIAQNLSTADPETITLPTTTTPGVYTIILVMATGAPVPYTGTVVLQPKPPVSVLCGPPADCTPPRYINYPAGDSQANDAGEPSVGVDWNPNVASLKNTTSPIFTTGLMRLNTGGVAFFTSGPHEWRVNFDDCPSPAVNLWEDKSATFTQQFVLSDPIGFVDHYSSSALGLAYPPPVTPGRVFTIDLIGGQGDSLGSYSDTDGNSYLPGGNGGPVQGPDHETLGGGPYNLKSTPAPPPQTVAYGSPNAIYYCSQNIVAEAQCSRSDNGGQTFGPGVPIFNLTACTGGIHGHVKVAPDGTVYVPNSSCGTSGIAGVAVSTDNGLTWTENNVPGSTGSQDPSVAVGQNNVGKVGSTNTIYLGWVSGDGHAHIADSHDRGVTWEHNTDVGTPFAITHAVFPVVVAGDDNRAAFGFLGTGPGIATTDTCDPYGATLNCANIWHLYIATTYDGGANWITIDATPNDPVQQGTVCLQGTTCAGGRNLLDFNDFAIDAQGRGLLGYADGCPNCGNAFTGQSSASHGTIARQSGGRRLFAHFDPIEPMPPAAPQMVSAVSQSPGALITWLEPDNGGSPITGYHIYRGTASGAELPLPLATVSGGTTTKYFDPSPPSGDVFYYVKAINAIGEGEHCGELKLTTGGTPETECVTPGLTKLTDPAGDTSVILGIVNTPAPPGADLRSFQIAQPYQPDNVPRLVFTINTWDNGQSPQPPGSAWYVSMKIGAGYKAVHMVWNGTTPTFESYTPSPNGSGGVDGRFVTAGSQIPAEATSSYIAPFNKVVIVVKASDLGLIPGSTINGFVSAVSQTAGGVVTGLFDMMPDSLAYTGSYTVDNNQVCRPNTPPVAVLTAAPTSGPSALVVHLDGSGSYDPDTAPPPDTIASYTFDFGDGSPTVTQSTPTINHTYTCSTSACDYPARLTVTDSRGAKSTNQAQVIIHVTGNTACKSPTANPDSATTTVNHSVVINVVANDNNGGSPPLTVTSVTQPSNGTATNNHNGTVTYTPNHNFVGTDVFTYTIQNGCGAKATGSVTVTVSQSTSECMEDDDQRMEFDNGWHEGNNSNATGGHYRYNAGQSNQPHGMRLKFQLTSNTGKVTYRYATSQNGGSADVYIDGAYVSTVSYKGNTGSMRNPTFGAVRSFDVRNSGAHTFETHSRGDGEEFDDEMCVENGGANDRPQSGPGQTTNSNNSVPAGQGVAQNLFVPDGALALSVIAVPSVNVAFKLIVVTPSGAILGSSDASKGLAVVEAPVSQPGLYVIQLVNMGVGPVNIWTAATPLVQR